MLNTTNQTKPVLSFLGALALLLTKTFNLFSFPIFWVWVYLMKVISETCCVHLIRWSTFIYVLITGVLTVRDDDSGQTVTVQLMDTTDIFYLKDGTTLVSKKSLNYEDQAKYNITVRATDDGTPSSHVSSFTWYIYCKGWTLVWNIW